MCHLKKWLTAALTAGLALSLCSCQLSKLLPNKPEEEETTSNLVLNGNSSISAPLDLKNTDLTPYLTLANYRGLSADETVEALTDQQLEAELNTYLQSITIYEKITDRPAAQGDVVVMDYVGKLDGVAFAGGTAQNQTITLSENSGYIAGFAEGLVGVMPGTTVDLTLTFPADYHNADMVGKTVVFTITVHYIQGALIPPALTDAFITRFTDGEFTTVETFRVYYRDYLEVTAVAEAHTAALNALWSQVFENSTFHSVPSQQIDYYYEQAKSQYTSYAQAYGMSYESILAAFGLTDDALRTQAENYAKQDLVFYALVQAEGLTVTDEQYAEKLKEAAISVDATAEELENYYGKDYLLSSFLWDTMMEMLYSYANITK